MGRTKGAKDLKPRKLGSFKGRPVGAVDKKTRKQRTSKYVGNTYLGWTVVHMGIAGIHGAGKYRGHRNYYYLVERITSDGKCIKQIRLDAKKMKALANGTFDIEAFADKKAHSKRATGKTNYAFI